MKHVAVVEDNPDNLLLVRVVLQKKYRITGYESGPEALAGLRANRPDVVLMDISLPVMDGEEVLREIRADAQLRDLPVVALTAHCSPGDRERFLAAGFDVYLAKPIIDPEDLVAVIERALRGAGPPGQQTGGC